MGQGFLMGPDNVRIEIYENKSIAQPMVMHHIHLIVPEPPAAQAWYVRHFGAVAGKRLGGVAVVRTQFDTANVPGAEITLSKANAPTVPTKVLLCRDDRLFPASFIRRVSRERLGISPEEIDGGHTPALSRPTELAARLMAYAAEHGVG